MPVSITLEKTFLDKYKNNATINTDFTITSAKIVAHRNDEDGDLHFAGKAPQIGFATVSEIMNGASIVGIKDAVEEAKSSGNTLALTGAWRLWPEHGAGSFVQGEEGDFGSGTNPNHVFEIHPVTKVGEISVLDSITEIDGFSYKSAKTAFVQYGNVGCTIEFSEKDVTFNLSRSIGYNYVKYVIELHEKGVETASKDAILVRSSVFDADTSELVIGDCRNVFIKGTSAYELFKNKNVGDRMKVFGMPRIDLALISWRINNATNREGVLNWYLPYEMVIVGHWES